LTSGYAQTDPIFFNLNNLNPAFVSSKDKLSVGVNYFVDRMDFESMNVSDYSLKIFRANVYTTINDKFGVGLAFSNLNYDVIKEKNLHLDLSYKYAFSSDMSLSFGASVGFNKVKASLDGFFLLPDGDLGSDNALDDINDTRIQYGFGLYYAYKKLQFGLSIPNLNKKNLEGVDIPSDFVISGLLEQPLSEKAKLEFGVYYVVLSDYDDQYYLSANVLIKNIIGVGINYKRDVFGIQLNSPKIADLFVVGFKVDFVNIEYLSDYNNNLMVFGNLETKSIFN